MSAGAHTAPTRLIGREFFTLAAATFLFFGVFGATNVVLPRFVDEGLGGSETEVGVVAGAIAVSSLLLRPLFGRLGDRRGARLLVVIGCSLGAVGCAAFVAADSLPTAVLARVPMGAANAAVMTGAMGLALDIAPPERRAEAASYVFLSFHLGLGLGPLVGDLALRRSSFDTVWLGLAAMMALGAVCARLLPHRPGTSDGSPAPLLHPNGVLPGVVVALSMTAFISFSTFVPLYAEEVGLDDVGLVFTLASVAIVVVRLMTSKVIDRRGPVTSCTAALCTIVAGSALLTVWTAPGGIFAGAAVLAGGGAVVMPSLVPVAVEGVEPHRRSSALATFTLFVDVAVAGTGPLFGLAASVAGYRATFVAGGAAALCSLAVVRLVLAPRWARRHEAAAPSVLA